jgi:hypothetical protein
MKYFCARIFALLTVALFAQEKISVLNGQLTFYVPEGTILESPPREFASLEEQKAFFKEKIGIWIGISNGNTITANSWGLSSGMENLVRTRRLRQQDFLNLLNTTQKKIVFSRVGPNDIEASHAFVKYNGVTIGEWYGSDGSIDAVAPPYHGYLIDLVVGDNIVHLRIKLHDEGGNLAKQLSEYFYFEEKTYKNYLWKNFRQSQNNLYTKLSSDSYRELPSELQRLREMCDLILNTLDIPGYSAAATYKTETALRLREVANATAGIITTLPANSIIKVLETGNMQTIDGITAKWVKVEIEDGQQGWCFSGYLKPIEGN